MRTIKQRTTALFVLLLPFLVFFTQPALAVEKNERAEVLKSFVGTQRGALVESYEEQQFQHKVMFVMGVILLLAIMVTAGLGIAMAMKGKDVFVPHMIFAGISVFLSIAHAVVGIVWFFPF